MTIAPFTPQHMGDLKNRLVELYEKTENVPGYSDSLRGEVLDLLMWCDRLIEMDAVSKGYWTEARALLDAGNARLALAKLQLALDSHLAA